MGRPALYPARRGSCVGVKAGNCISRFESPYDEKKYIPFNLHFVLQ
jgi:hypothetical protein